MDPRIRTAPTTGDDICAGNVITVDGDQHSAVLVDGPNGSTMTGTEAQPGMRPRTFRIGLSRGPVSRRFRRLDTRKAFDFIAAFTGPLLIITISGGIGFFLGATIVMETQ